MLASLLFKPESKSPKGEKLSSGNLDEACLNTESNQDLHSSERLLEVNPSEEYVQLQRRIYKAALIVSLLAVAFTAFFFGMHSAISMLLGAFSGFLYLRLLARNIGRLGNTSKAVGKVQLLVPVILFFAASRLPQLELLPALIGFLLYKPSLAFQILLESRTKATS